MITPALNTDCQTAITRCAAELRSGDPAETRFQALSLEDVTRVVGCAGAHAIAAQLTDRYLNFEPVHHALADTFQAAAGTG